MRLSGILYPRTFRPTLQSINNGFLILSTDQHDFAAIEAQRSAAAAEGDWIRFDELGGVQDRLGSFEPQIMHSYGEAAQPVRFHAQLICDIATVVEIGERLFRQIDTLR
jgi:hypothetical protein